MAHTHFLWAPLPGKNFSWLCQCALFMPYLKPMSCPFQLWESLLTLSSEAGGPDSCWELWWVLSVMD